MLLPGNNALQTVDIWSSSDGGRFAALHACGLALILIAAHWTQITANAAFGSRFAYSTAMLGSQLFLMGGAGPAPPGNQPPSTNDVWSASTASLSSLGKNPLVLFLKTVAFPHCQQAGRKWLPMRLGPIDLITHRRCSMVKSC